MHVKTVSSNLSRADAYVKAIDWLVKTGRDQEHYTIRAVWIASVTALRGGRSKPRGTDERTIPHE